jgi:hypothetical protein
MAIATFDPDTLPPMTEVIRFVRKLTVRGSAVARSDRRLQPRRQLVMPLSAVPLDDELHRSGEAFTAVVRDLSTRGIGFYHTRPLAVGARLGIELRSTDGDTLQTAVEIVRCRIDRGAYDIGCTFWLAG